MISFESPVGRALMGRKVNEVAVVSAPAGEIKYRILSIKK